jgi:hypothetical protein
MSSEMVELHLPGDPGGGRGTTAGTAAQPPAGLKQEALGYTSTTTGGAGR